MLLDILHDTHYHYRAPVQVAQHHVHLCPRNTDNQTVLAHQLDVSPAPTLWHTSEDAFGNARSFFALDQAHEDLRVQVRSRVRTHTAALAPGVDAATPWDRVRERFIYKSGRADDPASDFLFASPLSPVRALFADYARASFTPERPLLEAALDLTHRLHADFVYDGESSTVNTLALEAFAARRGVCQDFTHVWVACARSLGLPARYVSGYLLTHPPAGQPRLIGADASHAWAEVYLPAWPDAGAPNDAAQGQWFGFCPTNGRTAGEDFVLTAWGRDFADVSPIRGVIQGGGAHELDVAVTVMPVDEGAPPLAPMPAHVPKR